MILQTCSIMALACLLVSTWIQDAPTKATTTKAASTEFISPVGVWSSEAGDEFEFKVAQGELRGRHWSAEDRLRPAGARPLTGWIHGDVVVASALFPGEDTSNGVGVVEVRAWCGRTARAESGEELLRLFRTGVSTMVSGDAVSSLPEAPKAAQLELKRGPATASLNISVSGLRTTKGKLICRVYATEKGFPDDERAAVARAVVDATETSIQLQGLKPQSYAVVVHHDENGDGKLERGLLGPPTEGIGICGQAKLDGPPRFKSTLLQLFRGANSTSVSIHYF